MNKYLILQTMLTGQIVLKNKKGHGSVLFHAFVGAGDHVGSTRLHAVLYGILAVKRTDRSV